MLQAWIGLKRNFFLPDEYLDEVDRISCLGSCILPRGRISDKVSPRI